MSTDPTILRLRIDRAFADLPYPGDDRIVYDNTGTHLQCEDIKRLLKGHHWRDVPFELEKLPSAIFFLSPEGYRFYLPAFMIFSAVEFDRADVIPDEVIQTLTLPRAADLKRLSKIAKVPGEMQPFSQEEWETLLKALMASQQLDAQERIFFARVSGFTVEQSMTIREFLEYMRDTYGDEFPNREPELAIESYWHLFSP